MASSTDPQPRRFRKPHIRLHVSARSLQWWGEVTFFGHTGNAETYGSAAWSSARQVVIDLVRRHGV